MLTKDENLVDVTVSVQYRIKNLKDFVLNVRDPESSLREATESALEVAQELGVDKEILDDLQEAAEEVVRMYRKNNANFPKQTRVFRDTTASSAPVGLFYKNIYHTLVVAPATSNSIAKFVSGISDNLATNIFAQAGKCKVPCIVLACDTEPEHDTKAPSKMVKVYPRKVDLENTEKLKSFELTKVVNSVDDLKKVLKKI